jgi:hypothetical protein
MIFQASLIFTSNLLIKQNVSCFTNPDSLIAFSQLGIILLACSEIKDIVCAINQASPSKGGAVRSEGLIFLSK